MEILARGDDPDQPGLRRTLLDHCDTKEILLNRDQMEKEQRAIISWYQDRMAEDNMAMPNSPLSLDVKQVRCTLKDGLRLAKQVPYDRSSVILSESPGKEFFGGHKDRFVQLPIRVMIGKGVTWSLMITILTNPKQDGHSRRRRHTVRKFKVPEHITELLEGLPCWFWYKGRCPCNRGHVQPYGWVGLEALRIR